MDDDRFTDKKALRPGPSEQLEVQGHCYLPVDINRVEGFYTAGESISKSPKKHIADNLKLGVTSTNILVDVVQFFGTNVFADLQAAEGSVHPILVVDAVKFLYTFRNQVS